MKTLKQYHHEARQQKWAMPHMNFSNLEQITALVEVATELQSPLVVGLSEGERKAVGLRQAVALVKSFRAEGRVVFLNADHSHTKETAVQAIDAGFDSVHIDLSKEEYEKNTHDTKEVVEYARMKNEEIEVEGELGYLVTDSSKIYEGEIAIPEDSYTQPDQARSYVRETGVDRFASVFGNLHGIAANTPQVRFELVEKIRDSVGENITLVIHGGSGITDDDFRKLIQCGMTNAHINTEIRVAYTAGLRKELQEKPDEIAPYHYVGYAKEMMKEVVRAKIRLFGSDGKIS